jgi:formate--tetrahydrofolate ligase
MPIDPTKNPDWKIAEAAEKNMKTVYQLGEELGLDKEELLPHGHHVAKLDFARILKRLKKRPDCKYVDVTAITPTPLGEGKSTTTMGLTQGLGRRGKNVIAAIRQPSGGPTMNIKGSAAGGGLSQCIPLTPFSLGLTGDINAIMNSHNLAMVALTSRMQHEFNYNDAQLKKRKLKRLDINPRNVEMKWIIDFCAQALRDITIGHGGKMDGFMMRSGFAIAVSSEVMAILSVATDLKDMRERMGRIVVAYDKKGTPVTTEDLEVAGAMTAWMVEALNPNLMQSIEGQPVLVQVLGLEAQRGGARCHHQGPQVPRRSPHPRSRKAHASRVPQGERQVGRGRLQEPRSPHQDRDEGGHQPGSLHQRLPHGHQERNQGREETGGEGGCQGRSE